MNNSQTDSQQPVGRRPPILLRRPALRGRARQPARQPLSSLFRLLRPGTPALHPHLRPTRRLRHPGHLMWPTRGRLRAQRHSRQRHRTRYPRTHLGHAWLHRAPVRTVPAARHPLHAAAEGPARPSAQPHRRHDCQSTSKRDPLSACNRGSGSISVQIGKFARHVSRVRPCDEVHSRQSRLPVFW